MIERKTGKPKAIRFKVALEVIHRRRPNLPTDVWLYQAHCNRANNKSISRVSVSKALKDVGDTLGLNINTHSMRQSRSKAMYDAGEPIEKISKVLNSSDTGVTLRYLGITHESVMLTYDDFQL